MINECYIPTDDGKTITGLLGTQKPGDTLWPDNSRNSRFTIADKSIQVQDFYSSEDGYDTLMNEEKWKEINSMLEMSMGLGKDSDADWFFNWLSASQDVRGSPANYAIGTNMSWGMNRRLIYRFCRYELQAIVSAGDFAGNRWSPRGIIFMDYYRYPEKDWAPCVLPQVLIALNHSFKFENLADVSIGSWKGGKGGAEFNTLSGSDNVNDMFISSVQVRCGNRIDAIKACLDSQLNFCQTILTLDS
jgi:hypothetical protein